VEGKERGNLPSPCRYVDTSLDIGTSARTTHTVHPLNTKNHQNVIQIIFSAREPRIGIIWHLSKRQSFNRLDRRSPPLPPPLQKNHLVMDVRDLPTHQLILLDLASNFAEAASQNKLTEGDYASIFSNGSTSSKSSLLVSTSVCARWPGSNNQLTLTRELYRLPQLLALRSRWLLSPPPSLLPPVRPSTHRRRRT
jgi:hypothetical protein